MTIYLSGPAIARLNACSLMAANKRLRAGSFGPILRRGRIGYAALDAIAAAKVEAVNVLASPLLNVSRLQIIDRLRDSRLPANYQWPESAEDGGLLAYEPRNLLCYRHVVSLVDKVLRGAKPADLPIEQTSKLELAVNLKTASALGMTIPPTLLLRADEVIE
jgi:ABC-type uncharacterized transport system substrate-binding protein